MDYTCQCGAFRAEVEITPAAIRAVCYCESCRKFANATDGGAGLDAAGGSDLLQVAPEQVRFVAGGDNLQWTRMTPKGPVRWYTTCCRTPIANTLETPGVPFVTLMSHRLAPQDQLPPVRARVNRRFATERVPDGGAGVKTLMWNFAKRAVKSRLSGGWKRNPFFGPDRKPIASGKPIDA